MTLSAEDLNAIRERAQSATEGPWHTAHDEYGCVRLGDFGWVASGPRGKGPEYDVDSEQGKADAEFIAHVRTDVPLLLAEIDRLTIQAKTAEQDRKLAWRAMDTARAEKGDAIREADRLRTETP